LSPQALRTLAALGVERDVHRLGYGIHSLLLKTPGGRQLRLRGGESAVILLRKAFDHLLVGRAKALGVRFRDGLPVTGLLEERRRVVGVRAGTEAIRADYVVCADGAHSRFSIDRRPKHALATIMGWWENVAFEPGTIEMIFDRTLSPLYGWMFPESSSRVNIGITVDGGRIGTARELGNLRPVFAEFLQQHFDDRLRNARPVGRWCGHPIAYATWLRHGGAPGVLYVGEAVRLTNLATGEGISQAMQSGLFAADALGDVVCNGVPEERAWRRYRWTCRRVFTPGFLVGHLFRGAVKVGLLDAVASGFGKPRLRRLATRAIGSALTASSIRSDSIASGSSAQRAGVDARADSIQQLE
jgi:flavin-dependent dehydrogenase